ncbi:hypothetical protein ACHAO3_009083 [Verticillium nonalfalfae]
MRQTKYGEADLKHWQCKNNIESRDQDPGFEAIKQLLQQTQPYRVILGARNAEGAQKAFGDLKFDESKHNVTVLPLELADLKGVKTFAQQTLETLGQQKVDYVLLNAAISNSAEEPGPHGSKWCESYIVNHLSQHYLLHQLREKLVASQSRVVFVSSGAVRNVPEISALDKDLLGGSGANSFTVYCQSKLVNLLAAQWWRRQLTGQCTVVAVSPGLIPGTGLGRGGGMIPAGLPDAKTIPEGAENILRALDRDDLPEDPEQIFLTSWGEWWPKEVYAQTLDKKLQDKWCLEKEQIEQEEGITA